MKININPVKKEIVQYNILIEHSVSASHDHYLRSLQSRVDVYRISITVCIIFVVDHYFPAAVEEYSRVSIVLMLWAIQYTNQFIIDCGGGAPAICIAIIYFIKSTASFHQPVKFKCSQ